MIDRVAGIMNAAPIPWTARKATRTVSSGAKPIARLENPNTITPNRNMAPAPEDVAEPAARHEQHGEGQRVGVDRPLERRQRSVQVALDRRQRDVHDGVVEHDHEQREAHRAERPPAAVLVVDQAVAVGEDAARSLVVPFRSAGGDVRRARAVCSSAAAKRSRARCRSRSAAKCSRPCRRAAFRRRIAARPASVALRASSGGRRRPRGAVTKPAPHEVVDSPARGGQRDVNEFGGLLQRQRRGRRRRDGAAA